MYERFTDRARKVMQFANQEAQRFNHEYIGTEHILLGLVKEGSGVAINVLKNLEVALNAIPIMVEQLVQDGPMVTIGKLPHTPNTKRVIKYAIEETGNLNHNYVGTEHLLLGLLSLQGGIAFQVLTELNLSFTDVRDEILNFLGHGGTPGYMVPDKEINERIESARRFPVKQLKTYLQGTIMKPWIEQSLRELGYLTSSLIDTNELSDAIAAFQKFHGLNVDGDAGIVTERSIVGRMAFCRVPDTVRDNDGRCKWPDKIVKWAIRSYIPDLGEGEQNDLTLKAFHLWSLVSGLDPLWIKDWRDANIVISTGRGRRSNFDGPSGTLAWAFLPCGTQKSVDLKFDLDERWARGSPSRGRIIYYNVAVHEIGHALGIPHIQVGGETNIMAPVYSANVDELGPTDVKSIQVRYGEPDSKPDHPGPDDPDCDSRIKLMVDDKIVWRGK